MIAYVTMYHPALNNVRHDFPEDSVDTWEALGWVVVDGSAPPPAPLNLTTALGDLRYLKLGDVSTPGTATHDELGAAFVLATPGSYTYNTDGTVASEPNGKSYTYNTDGTVHTETLNGITRTYSYNTDLTVASVA